MKLKLRQQGTGLQQSKLGNFKSQLEARGSRTVSELCKLCPKIFHYHWLCPRFANYVRMLQTVSECCKLCPIDANYVRGLQTMSEGCKLCPNRDFRWIFKMQTMSEGCKLCPKAAISIVMCLFSDLSLSLLKISRPSEEPKTPRSSVWRYRIHRIYRIYGIYGMYGMYVIYGIRIRYFGHSLHMSNIVCKPRT